MSWRDWTRTAFPAAAALLAGSAAGSSPPATADLRVGAARVSITMPLAELPAPFTSVHDEVFLRALVIESGGKRAVMVIADAPMIHADVSEELTTRIAAAAKVPRENILLGLSHTHNNVRIDRNAGGIILPGSSRFVEQVTAAAMQAVQQAQARLKPARMGVGSGSAHLVGPKNAWSPELQRTVEAIDRSGASSVSEALGVIKFETPTGRPIAFVLNYGINPVVAMPLKTAISGDVPGAAARYVESRAGGDAVALFTAAAAGNPLYRAENDAVYGAADAANLIAAMGTILGEEAIAVARETRAALDSAAISARLRELVCPGKITAPLNLPDRCAHSIESRLPPCDFKDSPRDPVTLKMGVFKIGPVAFVQSDSDISAAVGQRLTRESPLANSWTVSLNFGPMRYVVADADYPRNTYEATASTAQRGCAEAGFISNALAMIGEVD